MKNICLVKKVFFVAAFAIAFNGLQAQSEKLLLDKPGTFKMEYSNDYDQDECNFSFKLKRQSFIRNCWVYRKFFVKIRY